MYQATDQLLTLEELEQASATVQASSLAVFRTPSVLAKTSSTCGPVRNLFSTLGKCRSFKSLPDTCQLYLKLENLQNTGSFKLRGVANQMEHAAEYLKRKGEGKDLQLVTMSAGNYGRTFGHAAKILNLSGTVILPESAPANRTKVIEDFGLDVERMPTDKLMEGVKRHERDHGAIFLHPFDDLSLISGYSSLSKEILEDCPDVDIVLVCCGGGGLLAGIGAGINAYSKEGKNIKVYGVEPKFANGMYTSLKKGRAVSKVPYPNYSVASGLNPPFAGHNAFQHVKAHVDGIILVSDEEMVQTVDLLFRHGLVVEPSGTAALTAVLTGRLEQIEGSLEDKTILTVLTGGNMSPQEVGFKNRRNLKIEPCLPKEPMFILNKNKKKRVLK